MLASFCGFVRHFVRGLLYITLVIFLSHRSRVLLLPRLYVHCIYNRNFSQADLPIHAHYCPKISLGSLYPPSRRSNCSSIRAVHLCSSEPFAGIPYYTARVLVNLANPLHRKRGGSYWAGRACTDANEKSTRAWPLARQISTRIPSATKTSCCIEEKKQQQQQSSGTLDRQPKPQAPRPKVKLQSQ